mmetsp:Transcript_58037/g.186466  ORF Transcript_58037/g.186466 Transcript_58037/m.186466 type:complete len:232 (+) Transcript_58037:700-1395(+)
MAWWYNRWQREIICPSSLRPVHAERALCWAPALGVDGVHPRSVLCDRAVCGAAGDAAHDVRTPGDHGWAWLSATGLDVTEHARREASPLGLLRRLARRRPKVRESCCSRWSRQSSSTDADHERCCSGPSRSRARHRKPNKRSKLTKPLSSLSSKKASFSQNTSSSSTLHSNPKLSRMHGRRLRGMLSTSPSARADAVGWHNWKASRSSRSSLPWHKALEVWPSRGRHCCCK